MDSEKTSEFCIDAMKLYRSAFELVRSVIEQAVKRIDGLEERVSVLERENAELAKRVSESKSNDENFDRLFKIVEKWPDGGGNSIQTLPDTHPAAPEWDRIRWRKTKPVADPIYPYRFDIQSDPSSPEFWNAAKRTGTASESAMLSGTVGSDRLNGSPVQGAKGETKFE